MQVNCIIEAVLVAVVAPGTAMELLLKFAVGCTPTLAWYSAKSLSSTEAISTISEIPAAAPARLNDDSRTVADLDPS